MKKLVGIIVVLLLLAGGSFFFLGANGKPANGITTVNPVRGAVVVKAVAIGQIEPIHQISVKSKTSGIVRRVFVEVGDRVRAGQALIEVEPDPTPLEYAEARRQVELERVALDNARAVFERSRELKHQGVISARDFDEAERGFRDAEVRVKLAEERLTIIDKGKVKIAERAVETTLKAPVAGTILERKVNEGDPVVPLTSYQAGTELLTLADMGTLLFRGTVDEIDVGKIVAGMPVTLKIGALPDRPIAGRLSKISPKAKKVDNATVFDVEVEIGDRGDAVIRAGYSANAEVVLAKKDGVLTIPERLVQFSGSKASVELLRADGSIEREEIEVGLSDGITIEVVSGLGEADRVVERPPKSIV
jgi:HlyD family secretion protein